MKKLIQKGELNISRQEIAPLERTSEGQLRGGFSTTSTEAGLFGLDINVYCPNSTKGTNLYCPSQKPKPTCGCTCKHTGNGSSSGSNFVEPTPTATTTVPPINIGNNPFPTWMI